MALLDESFGVIVFRMNNDEPEFLLLKHGQGHWSYPKGHKDAGESIQEAALRELREESGIKNIKLLADHPEFEEEYWYQLKGKLIHKVVKYFIGEVDLNAEVEIDNKEISGYKWVHYKQAVRVLTFDNSKDILKKSFNKIKSLKKNGNV